MTVRLTGTRALLLEDVAYCPRLLTTLVSLRQLRRKGLYWDNRHDPTTLRWLDLTLACPIQDIYGQYVIEYQPVAITPAALTAHKFNSYTKRAPLTGEAIRWHSRLGHPGPQALEHLVSASQGVRIRGPTTVECDACGLSKVKRQVRRAPRQQPGQTAGERIAVDFHDYEEGIDGYTSQMLLTCRATGYIWDYYLTARTADAIITAFKAFLGHMERQHSLKVRVIECDNEITEVKPKVGDFLRDRAIILEPSAPHTQAQNGGAERSGGVIKDKERAMRTGAKLPHQLWPEIGRTAVYLYNRTPSYRSGWKTPYDQLHTALAKLRGIPQPKKQPDQTHLRAFGCKAYAMTSEAQQKVNRKMRLKPKGWIGFLVGYRSSNIYRIWIPTINRIVNTRDVIFNEDEICNGDWEQFKDDLLEADLKEIAKFAQDSTLLDQDSLGELEAEDSFEITLPINALTDDGGTQLGEADETVEHIGGPYTTAKFVPFPTPPESPPSALLVHSIQTLHQGVQPTIETDEGITTVPWQAAFLAGAKTPLQTSIERALRQGMKMHRSNLPPPPRKHQDLIDHPFGKLFQKAEEDHLQSHKEMKSWTEIRAKDPRASEQQVLGCMWVYVYKFDKHGRFQKCKARLVVRGDQQAKGRLQETYAATLAGRSFRTLVAIAAKFDLEMVQYDVVNAFVHAPINQDIFMHMPPGYKKAGTILQLNKALYGLRVSPLLWQKELSKTLLELGYEQVPHEPCCFKKEGILFFFYVDDVIVAYRKSRGDNANELIKQLRLRYKLTGGNPVQWFLGMEVIRDRPARKIWLSQTAYIDKIANLANKGTATVPMTQIELRPRIGLATPAEIQRYQRIVGSVLYIAVNTRPDIAFTVSRLARFLTNPGRAHQEAADRVIHYLSHTKHRALAFGGAGGLKVASDASFADNTLDRKSSQAYTIKLFNGLIGWRASKQDTVTTSTTEAELLALAQAAKESLYVSRLLKELTVQLDDSTIQIDCDNTQTINLVTAEVATLKTKLRHVDIHNHWLRQEVQGGKIQVKYTKSTDMIADGLTKALPAGKWNRFLYQLGLEDIQEREQNRKQEGIEERLQNMEDCL
ncbi:Retrovirus-related Pol polyprotein from transposon TNT [Fusarium oxysporum f. sp. conglutinans]|nr:Retrovirus-related Pol polyprotein from transposon TNT [Fusarium oxysporum f. sp. conglutinans]